MSFSKLFIIGNTSKRLLSQLPKSQIFSSIRSKSTNSQLINKQLKTNNLLFTQIRGSHDRQLFIRPGFFYTKKTWDIIVILFI